MGPSHRRLGWLCAGLILAAAGSASAQTTRARRPQPPPAASAPDDTVGNVTGDTGLSSAVPGSPGRLPLAPPPPAPPVLRSAIRSRYSRPAVIGRSTTGQCRVGCAQARNACANGQGDTSGCDPGWTQCLSACAGLSYSRGP